MQYLVKDRLVSIWLFAMCFAIILMIFIGGLTRLTNSGLSITEWKPITGILPPLSSYEWEQEFNKYKQSPEYIKHNFDMQLEGFKSIYLLEFYHRIAGRITSLLFFFPLIFFLISGRIKIQALLPYTVALVVLGSQGIMGWYMVKSGLVDNPHVSHFRLAGHLMLAVFLYMILFWQLLANTSYPLLLSSNTSIKWQKKFCRASILLLLIQMIFGAFVAGLDAGLVYNNFPLMGESFMPEELLYSNLSLKSFFDPVFIQFMHRICAYILFFLITIFCFFAIKLENNRFSKSVFYVAIALLVQMILGILTLIYAVPITIALLHQLGAMLLLSCLLYSNFLLSASWNNSST